MNLVRAERSGLCIIAYVEKKKTDRESKQDTDMETNISRSKLKRVASVSHLKRIDEYSRSEPTMEIELAYGESRGYWKHYSPGKWFKQAKAVGKINNVKATLLFDSGAEVSIIDTTFAREVGCNIDESQRQECIGIGEAPYLTIGRAKIKVTLAGSLVYYFNVWVGDLAGQEAILGMDFMVPAGVRLDLADGALCLPEEIRIHLAGRRPAYGSKIQHITAKDQHVVIPVGESREVKIGIGGAKMKLWVARGPDWVPTVISGFGRRKYLQMTNTGDREIILPTHTILGMWTEGDMVPRTQGFVTVGSGKYKEWQTLAYEATTDRANEPPTKQIGPLVDRPTYATPKRIVKRPSNTLKNLSPAISTVKQQANNGESQKADAVIAKGETVNKAELLRMENDHEIGTQQATKGDRDIDQEWLRDRSSLSKADPTNKLLKLGQPGETKEPKEEAMLKTEDAEIAGTPVYYHESGDLFAEDIEQHMAVLPEMSATTGEVTIEDIQIGDPNVPLTTEQHQLRLLIWKSRHLLMGKGNALPPAARGAICDIDVGGAAPIAQRVRPVAPKYREKLSDLIKGLLAAKIVQPSTSPWASPIVVIIKKNGVDIRLCIDYRRVNQLTRLMVYPMPLISDLLEDLDKALWYCSLDMASGFWVVEMTERAKLISAFVTPFGLFEWLRMPFGLKNAPQIYQRLVDNALYGYLKIGQRSSSDGQIGVFKDGEPETDRRPSILGRRSYIDDILIPATSWESLYAKVERLLEACDKWNLSISLTKSFWGCRKVDYLGHRVSIDGLEAQPKNLESLVNIPFPSTLRAMQSFLGSLNYYRRFIEDFAVYAAVLYELRESDFFEIGRSQLAAGDEWLNEDRWTEAKVAFTMLKAKIATAPMLKHFDPDRPPVIVVYASKWAVSAALIQEYDGVYHPVTFTSRTLKPNELNYGTVEKEVLAILRVLDVCYTTLASREITVLTRHSTLAWLMQSRGLNGRLGRWAALLSNWTMEVKRCEKGEEEILGMLAASITPREEVEEMLIAISPRKDCRLKVSMPPPTVEADEELLVASFDGSARIKKKGGSYSAVVWKLPKWTIVAAESRYAHDLTVNEAEYNGLLLCFELLADLDRGRVILCGDSNLVIRQMRGEIDCKAPGLQLLRHKALEKLRSWPSHEFLHMKREWNQSADRLASTALQSEKGRTIVAEEDRQNLMTLNRLDELLKPKQDGQLARITAITRSAERIRHEPEVIQEEIVQRIRIQRIVQAQDEERWIVNLKKYLSGDVSNLDAGEVKVCAKLAPEYEIDESDLLFFCPTAKRESEDRDGLMRLVIPETLQQDFLHHYHTSLEGGHQGIGRTYQKIRSRFHWRGLYRSVQRYVGECTDCETGKGSPMSHGRSPGNLHASYPFQIIAMDHIPSLPKSIKGNTELLIWVDLFSGYVIAKASSSRTAQTIAENYEECVFRRFGASEAIRHDREPGFMSDFFRAFSRIVGQKQRATMAYRPQANGTAERMVQTLTHSLKMYVAEVDQRDWDEYAERLTFAINTAQDRVRGDTPFYLIHGWDPRSTLEATLSVGNTRTRDRDPKRWRYSIQRQYQRARSAVNDQLRLAIQERADLHNEDVEQHEIEVGTQVWLYLDRVKEGYAKKLAHMWHGPFRVADICGDHAVKLEIAGTPYRLFPIVHLSKLKKVKTFPERPKDQLTIDETDRLDFDEALLPEDSWENDLEEGEYEVEEILDVRSGRKTRYGRVHRQFLVKWKGHADLSWVDEADLSCGAILQEFERNRVSRNRFEAMQSHEGKSDEP